MYEQARQRLRSVRQLKKDAGLRRRGVFRPSTSVPLGVRILNITNCLIFDKKKGIKNSQNQNQGGIFTINIRISPELHKAAAVIAGKKGISLNTFVEKAIYDEVYAL